MARCPNCGGPGGVALVVSVAPCSRCENTARMRRAPPGLTLADLGVRPEPVLRWVMHDGPGIPAGALLWESWSGRELRDETFSDLLPHVPRIQDVEAAIKVANDSDRATVFLKSLVWSHWGYKRGPLTNGPLYDQTMFMYMVALVKGEG